jgi:hypothetical protein
MSRRSCEQKGAGTWRGATQAHQAHLLPYKQGLSNMPSYDPRRFTWVYDASGEAKDCVKVRDNQTGRIVIWPFWAVG